MSRTRTFIAVEIGDEIRRNAVALQQRLAKLDADVRWAAPETMHVTLLFLGEVDDRAVVDVCRAVKDVARREPPFPLRVSGVGAFPTARRPKTIWAGVSDGAEQLQRLHGLIEAKLMDLGCYRKEERAYTPHLTLGRAKSDAGGHTLTAELPKLLSWNGGRRVVDEVVVFASELTRYGPEYTALGRGALAGSAS
jgi:2'-5' RNA ligase